jgi:putative oxygen-independent coproporphyrinogen III oxidase
MASLPDGDPAPSDGLLPDSAARHAATQWGLYVHVPFCRVRCGYCDFNTYTQSDMPGVSHQDYAQLAMRELAFAESVLEKSGIPARELSTVFFGGGTPTLLPAADLIQVLNRAREAWGLNDDAEVTVEANPDTLSPEYVEALAEGGVTRVSLGVQSFVPHVLSTLERTHNPDSVPDVVEMVKNAGLQVSLDLIYGTPGETAADWQHTLDRALELEPDHISAYSLIVEPGTALARRVNRGEVDPIDDDTHAEYYELADDALTQAGYQWYEVSNWARSDDTRSRHNLSYWSEADWWGVGPGAHSHLGGVRWWNVKHPKAYADRLRADSSPALAREVLDDDQRYTEMVMLRIRTRNGLDTAALRPGSEQVVAWAIAESLVDPAAALAGRLTLTRAGRLLADQIALRLVQS